MPGRLAWPDSTRGLAILLVVLLHSTLWVGYLGESSAALTFMNSTAASLRMPVFFCVAGIFASKWMAADWRDLITSKLALLMWVFLMWQPVFFGFKYLAARTLPEQDPSLLGHLARMIASPIRPNGETWFLWALVVYLVVAKLLRNVPPAAHLAAAGIASLIFNGLIRPWLGADNVRLMGAGLELVVPLYFFFAAGVLLRSRILSAAQKGRWPTFVSIAAVWAIGASIAGAMGVSRAPVLEFILQVSGCAAGICIGALLQKTNWLRRLGRDTLPIYVGHMLFVSLAVIALYVAGVRVDSERDALAFSLTIATLAVLLSIALWQALRTTAFRFMYQQPRWFALPAMKRVS